MSTDLKELADKIEDISDPTAIDKVLFHIYQIHEEDNEFMELLFDTCKDEMVLWEQPWYQTSTCLTRRLQETNEEETEQYRTDAITQEEDKKIKKNWRKFIKKYSLPDKLISFARWRNKSGSRNPNTLHEKVRRYVAAYLARGLQRTVYQVYRHVTSHMAEPVTKHYTPEEEKIMKVCFHHKPSTAVTYLSTILCREPRGIYKRFTFMTKGKPLRKRLKWTLPVASKFLNSLMKHSGMSVDELKCKKIDKSVWSKVEDDMDHPHEYLQSFWYKYLHVQLFVKKDIKLYKLRKKTLKLLKAYESYKVWTDIRWKELLIHFSDGITHRFLYKICYSLIGQYPNYLRAPLEEVIEYGLVKMMNGRFKERRLKTLKLNENGQLEIIQYTKDK